MGEVNRYRYKNADLLIRGVRDFLKGIDWLEQTDAEALHRLWHMATRPSRWTSWMFRLIIPATCTPPKRKKKQGQAENSRSS